MMTHSTILAPDKQIARKNGHLLATPVKRFMFENIVRDRRLYFIGYMSVGDYFEDNFRSALFGFRYQGKQTPCIGVMIMLKTQYL